MSSAQRKSALRATVSLLATVLLLLVLPATALAQSSDPTAGQYPKSEEQTGQAEARDPGDGDGGLSSNVAGLPFTGVDLLIVAGAGAALLGTGVVLRRLSTPSERRS